MMNELLQIPLFPVFITLAAFYIGGEQNGEIAPV